MGSAGRRVLPRFFAISQKIFEMSERCNISPRFSMNFFGRCNISRTFRFYNTLIKYGGDTTMTWPFENDTSAITKKLAQRSFKANKLRNIVAVIAIVLTSMLFTSVTTLCVGAIQSIQTTILQIRGTSPSTGTSVNWIAIIAALFFIMIFPTFFNQPDLWLFTIQPTIFPLILEGIVICVVAIIVPHVSFRYFRKTSIVARLRVVE